MKPDYLHKIPENTRELLESIERNSDITKNNFSSETATNLGGSITHYKISEHPCGNIVLLPGMASNTNIDPLMRVVRLWSLHHNYNVYALNHFFGDFKMELSKEDADKQTYLEYIAVITRGLNEISEQVAGKWTAIVSHSMAARGTIEYFNDLAENNKKHNFAMAALFGPFASQESTDNVWRSYRMKHGLSHISKEEFAKTPVSFNSPSNPDPVNTHISFYPPVLDPKTYSLDQMEKWRHHTVFVAGGKDRRAPAAAHYEVYRKMIDHKMENAGKFKYVNFPESKHSFMDSYKDYAAVLTLIKHLRMKKWSAEHTA
ncbi:MAG: hypothetical protein LBJ18_03405 [Rickettsiales bacterium]|jgi:hypothetical protein|nr:hypothetical protein [Rickettsiales bacterium]